MFTLNFRFMFLSIVYRVKLYIHTLSLVLIMFKICICNVSYSKSLSMRRAINLCSIHTQYFDHWKQLTAEKRKKSSDIEMHISGFYKRDKSLCNWIGNICLSRHRLKYFIFYQLDWFGFWNALHFIVLYLFSKHP